MITLKMAILPKLVWILCNTIKMATPFLRVSNTTDRTANKGTHSVMQYCWFALTCDVLRAVRNTLKAEEELMKKGKGLEKGRSQRLHLEDLNKYMCI